MPAAEAEVIADLARASHRNVVPLWIIPDADINHGYFGRITSNPRVSWPEIYSRANVGLDFMEDPRGRPTVEVQPFTFHPGDDLGSDFHFTRASTALQIAETLQLSQAAANIQRDDHHPALGIRALLLEPERSNGWSYTEDLSISDWTKTNCSISVNAIAAPDGAMTADKIVEASDSAQQHMVQRQPPSLTPANYQSVSFFAKAAERTMLGVLITTFASTDVVSYIDLSDGTVHYKGAGHTIEITPCINGWYRIAISFDSGMGGNTPNVKFALAQEAVSPPQNAITTYNGDGVSGLYLWGLQFEVNKRYPTSYIPRLSVGTATRAEELAYWDFTTPVQQKTLYIRFIERGTIQAQWHTLMMVGNASGATWIWIHSSGTYYRVTVSYAGAYSKTSLLSIAPALGDLVEIRACLHDDGHVQIHQSINGAAEASATASDALEIAMPSSYTGGLIAVGSDPTTSHYIGRIEVLAAHVLHGIQNRATCRSK